ncbi:MAG: hypothetical protein KDD82_11725 [Planctomycetes bacterium]|nr:hypothetical protein [Planctomycetota bacterium]
MHRTCFALLAALTVVVGSAPAQETPSGKRTVYVPIEKFDDIFDDEGGGVFIPIHELEELIAEALRQATGSHTPVKAPDAPPADYVLVGAQFKGVAGESVVRFDATFDFEVLKDDGWVVIPIGLGEAALESVNAEGGRAIVGPLSQFAERAPQDKRQAMQRAGGYGIVVKGAGRVTTTARFAVPIQSAPGQSSFNLTLPSAALNEFRVTLPQSGLRVKVDNALATEEQSPEGSDQTDVRAYFGAAASAKVTWNPRPKEVEGVTRDPLLFASTEAALWVDEGSLQATVLVNYRIRQAPCDTFELSLPAGYTLLSVVGDNMRSDPVPTEQPDGSQKIVIKLHEKVSDAYALTVRMEAIREEGKLEVSYPRVVAVGSERESGILAASSTQYLTLEPTPGRGVTQIDAGGLTQTLAKALRYERKEGRPPLVFRYLRQPYALNLRANPVEPEVEGKLQTLAVVRDDEVKLTSTVLYTIRKRGIFGARVLLPAGFELDEVGDERTVKDHRLEEPTDEEKALGAAKALAIDFVRQQNPTPEGRPFPLTITGRVLRSADAVETDAWSLPTLHLSGVKRETGVLAVASMTHLKLTLEKEKRKGLTALGTHELPQQSFLHGVRAGEEISFAFTYAKPKGIEATFAIKKREPRVSVRTEALVDAQEDVVRVETALNYTVEFAGVEQIRFRAPKALGTESELKIEGANVKDKLVADDPEQEGRVIWTVPLQGKAIGNFTINLRYDIKLENLVAGKPTEVSLHEIEVLDCFTETGDIALKKHENLVITDSDAFMVERRDKRELPERLRNQGAIQAYRYVSHPHTLTLNLVKYNFRAPVGILVEHLHLDEVINRDGKVQVEATLALRNNAEQSLSVLLPAGAEFVGLQVAGETEEWSEGQPVGDRPTVLVTLGEATKANRDEAFQIRLRYNLPGKGELSGMGTIAFSGPEFPLLEGESVPVARLTRRLYLPTDLAYLEFDTDGTKHFEEWTFWEQLKLSLGVPTGRERHNPLAGASRAEQEIANLLGMAKRDPTGYQPLNVPADDPYLIEKLDNPMELKVRFSSWALFYLLDVLALLGVVGAGVLLDRKQILRAGFYAPLAVAACLLGAAFVGRATEPLFASGFVGALGLSAFALLRGVWQELTVRRHERRLAELQEEAQVARARAQAAEAEARLRGNAPAPAAAVAASPKKAPGLSPEERRAAEEIPLQKPDDASSSESPSSGTDA